MERKYDEALSNHTTFNIGGPAKILSIPESQEELISEIRRCQKEGINFRILGNGSNILVDDEGVNDVVIKNTKACTTLERNGNEVYVGASVFLLKFVEFCVNNNLEGMEYLYSVPGTIGGAIYMNAGRGKKHNLSISNNLISVKIFDGKKIKELKQEDCRFTYRGSIFHENNNWIILGAKFKLEDQPKEIGEKKIRERKNKVNNWSIYEHPSAGSVFKKTSSLALHFLSGLRIGDAKLKGKQIVNLGNATYKDVLWLIKISKFFSYLAFKKTELEIEIWE